MVRPFLSLYYVLLANHSSGGVSVPVFDTMTHLIARISNRVIFGLELCRNEDFLHAVVRFAETTPLISPFIQWSPLILRPYVVLHSLVSKPLSKPCRSVVYFTLSSILGGKKGALKFIIPYLEKYMEVRKNMSDRTVRTVLLFPSSNPE